VLEERAVLSDWVSLGADGVGPEELGWLMMLTSVAFVLGW
jgi:hypothetical protein